MSNSERSISTHWYVDSPKKSSPVDMITKSMPITTGVTEAALRAALKDFKDEILQQVCDELDRIESRLAEISEKP